MAKIIAMADEWRERIKTHGPYIVMRTLMGGTQDTNRRRIYDLRTMDDVEVFNEDMKPWTAAMQKAVDDRCAELNAPFLAERLRSEGKLN